MKNVFAVTQTAGAADELTLENLQNMEVNQIVEYVKGMIPDVISFGLTIILALVVYFIGSKMIKYLRKFIHRSFEKSGVDKGVIQFADALIKALAYALLFVVIIGLFGIETTSFIAVFGSAGVAIGLALQGSLSNFAGGVLILALKPFVVGDYIVTNAGDEGSVTEISLFSTKLLTVDNRAIVNPNGSLSNNTITNVTNQDYRRLDISVGISYKADLLKAKDILNKIYENDESIMKDRPIQVFVDQLGESAVVLGARGWLAAADYWTAKWRITELVKLSFDEAGIEIPFNQMDVHIHTEKD